jgi:hypothetical protein
MFFMAYSPQPTVAVDSNYRSGNARLDQEKGRRALRRRPCPATAGSRAGSEQIHVPTSPTTQRALEPGQRPVVDKAPEAPFVENRRYLPKTLACIARLDCSNHPSTLRPAMPSCES